MENTVEEEAKAKAKRARKRSRYLSPPYTYTFADDVVVCDHWSEELMASCTNVAAADMLSALHAAALLDAGEAGVEMLRRFFTLHRNSSSSRDTAEADYLLSPSSSSSSSSQNKDKEISPNKKKTKKAAAASTPTRRPRLPLTDVRNNLEKMISSLLGRSPTPTTSHGHDHGAKLAGEMRCLLAKVDKMLAAAHRH